MYDIIIIGGGPAGMSCAIYSARYGLKTLVLSEMDGGLMAEAAHIENYPGIKSVLGMELSQKMKEQVLDFDVDFKNTQVKKIEKRKDGFVVNNEESFEGKSIVLAIGMKKRKLNIKGEDKLLGRGISYCATCDALFFKDKTVAVIGGSNAAATAALLLAEKSKKVYIIYRKDKLRAEPIWMEKIEKNPKIEVIYNTNIVEAVGKEKLEKVKLDTDKDLEIEGLFVEIGQVPSTILVKDLGVKTDKEGYIVVDAAMKTNIKGVYAAGDITTGSNKFRQIITAAAEGSIAAASVYEELSKQK